MTARWRRRTFGRVAAGIAALLLGAGDTVRALDEAEILTLIGQGRDCLWDSGAPAGSTAGATEGYQRLLDDQQCLRVKQKNYLRCARKLAETTDPGKGTRYFTILRRALLETDADAGGGAGAFRCQLIYSDDTDLSHLVTEKEAPEDSQLAGRQSILRRLASRDAHIGECVRPPPLPSIDERKLAVERAKEPLPEGAFPDAVGFVRGSDSQAAFCSGVMVSTKARAVLTAAHCVCNRGIPLYLADEKGALRAVVARRLSRSDANAECQSGGPCVILGNDVRAEHRTKALLYPIAGAVLFYRDSCPSVAGAAVRGKDLALVFLPNVIEPPQDRSATQQPPERFSVCGGATQARYGLESIARDRWIIDAATYRSRASQANSTLHAVGFGRSSKCPGMPPEPEKNPKKLWAHIPVRSAWCGNEVLAGLYGCRTNLEALLVSQRLPDVDLRCMPDTCSGDSGGPVYWRDANGYHFLAAITSRGLPGYEQSCGRGGIYTLVNPRVNTWMREWGIDVLQRPSPPRRT